MTNRNRLALMALIRQAITSNYSIRGLVDEQEVFVSPSYLQWFEDGVVFLQGRERFAGLIGLYRDGEVRFGIVTRDIPEGGAIGPEDMDFLSIDEHNTRRAALRANERELLSAVQELEALLQKREESEATYQKLIEANPWVLGAKYTEVVSHTALDDRNIPDFSGIRATDKARDVIEIKSPFAALFRSDGSFRAEFLQAIDQAERYLDFAREQRIYLLEKRGLRFENPRAVLIIGDTVPAEHRDSFRRKAGSNPAIDILTYRDVLRYAKETVAFFENRVRRSVEGAT